jgi:hypothetical protein
MDGALVDAALVLGLVAPVAPTHPATLNATIALRIANTVKRRYERRSPRKVATEYMVSPTNFFSVPSADSHASKPEFKAPAAKSS